MSTDINRLSSNNIQIAKNTIYLYCRVIIILCVNLYVIRLVFKALGVVDYGIYEVVAGFAASFSFLSRSISSALQRFLSFCIGKNDVAAYNKYFGNCYVLFVCFSFTSLILLESFGVWFVCEKMVIPVDRLNAALWVFQSAVFSLIIIFITIPYNAVIISYERMDIFAGISIFDVFLKLVLVFCLQFSPSDRLIIYSLLYSFTGLVQLLLYRHYANKIHNGLKIFAAYDISYIKEVISFTGWNLFGSVSGLVRGQGLNILINIYFGPVFNAARSIAYQVYNAVNAFAGNFMTAVNPQIIKMYASNQSKELEMLVFRSSKISFTLLTIIAYPLIILMPSVLDIWLGNSPHVTVLFSRLVMVSMLVESISLPLLTLAQATGKLKMYQTIVGGLLIMNLPVSWFAFEYLNTEAYVCFVILIIINVLALVARLFVLKRIAKLNIPVFIRNVMSKWLMLMLLCYIGYLISRNLDSYLLLIVTAIMTLVIIPLFSLYVILNLQERERIIHYVFNRIIK